MGTVRCAHCGASEEIALARSEVVAPDLIRPSDDAAADGTRCPKCRVPVGKREACPGCGLAVARMTGFAAAQRAEVPDSVHAAWDAVLERWDDQARHDTLVQQVAAAEAFAWAAGQYQEVRQRRPHDRIAERQLERVRRTAEAAMLASATVRESDKRPYRSTTTILVMMVVVLLAGGLYATFMRDTRGSGPRTTPVAPRGAGVPRSVHLQGR
jgi:uncharacterized Zn finger protein (UPF0148 family)